MKHGVTPLQMYVSFKTSAILFERLSGSVIKLQVTEIPESLMNVINPVLSSHMEWVD